MYVGMTGTKTLSPFRVKLYQVIFEADTPAGKFFDIVLIFSILASIVVVMFDSIHSFHTDYGEVLYTLEWIFTLVFTVEYILRLYCVLKPAKYAISFYGIIDLLAILPTYMSLLIMGSQTLIAIRALRLLRIFRILKLGNFMVQGSIIMEALRSSRNKILLFLYSVFLVVIIIGTMMYLIEGSANSGFDSIPRSIYWAIVTLTTVGYGDITPTTIPGQFLSAFVMIIGYAMIAVPTGIVSAEFVDLRRRVNQFVCPHCSSELHDSDAKFCKYCGGELS